MSTDEESNKPRQLIHRVQAECIRALDTVRRARGESPGDDAVATAERDLHYATMLYWEQIKRFRNRGIIETEWHEEPVFDDTTLDDLQTKRLTTEQVETTEVNPDTGTTHTVRVEQPWQLSPQQAVQVIDQLDDCAHKLGFDAEADSVTPESGAGLDADEIDADDMDYLNSEVEVGGDV